MADERDPTDPAATRSAGWPRRRGLRLWAELAAQVRPERGVRRLVPEELWRAVAGGALAEESRVASVREVRGQAERAPAGLRAVEIIVAARHEVAQRELQRRALPMLEALRGPLNARGREPVRLAVVVDRGAPWQRPPSTPRALDGSGQLVASGLPPAPAQPPPRRGSTAVRGQPDGWALAQAEREVAGVQDHEVRRALIAARARALSRSAREEQSTDEEGSSRSEGGDG